MHKAANPVPDDVGIRSEEVRQMELQPTMRRASTRPMAWVAAALVALAVVLSSWYAL